MPEGDYGLELILDLHGCDVRKFTRESIEQYFVELCDLIDMKREDLHFWDDEDVPEEQRQTDPKTKGISAVQFILTSSIVIHALPLLESAYVNIFSCKDFDTIRAEAFTEKWFAACSWTSRVVIRN
jgi:S-adenosylmethionine/arginine decarboxylase-like enzyme